MMKKSQRRTERVLTRWDACVLHPTGRIQAEVTDVNEHGLFLRTAFVVEPETILRIEVALPEGIFEAYGCVRFAGSSVSGHGLGIELLGLPARDRARWVRAYHELLPDWEQERLAAAA